MRERLTRSLLAHLKGLCHRTGLFVEFARPLIGLIRPIWRALDWFFYSMPSPPPHRVKTQSWLTPCETAYYYSRLINLRVRVGRRTLCLLSKILASPFPACSAGRRR